MSDIQQFNENVSAIDSIIESLKNDNATLKAALLATESERDELKKKQYNPPTQAIHLERDRLEVERNQLRAELDIAKDLMAQMRDQLDRLRADLATAKAELETITTAHDELVVERQTFKEQACLHAMEVAKTKSENAALRDVARVAKSEPCRHDISFKGEECPLCVALRTLAEKGVVL